MQLSSKLWELNIPFLNCKSYGFLGYIRVQVKEHTVIESHPENQPLDLRLDKPFPALVEYVNSVRLEEMGLKDHAHVPHLVILFKYLEVKLLIYLRYMIYYTIINLNFYFFAFCLSIIIQ